MCRRSVTEHRSPYVTVPSCTKELVDFLKATFGGQICQKRTYQERHSKSWVWAVGHDAALYFLASLLPYLREPEKVRRATLLVNGYKAVTPRNGKYSSERLAERHEFERSFFSRSKNTHSMKV